jgi:hypothetical protein
VVIEQCATSMCRYVAVPTRSVHATAARTTASWVNTNTVAVSDYEIVQGVGHPRIEGCESFSPVEVERLGRRTPRRPLERPSQSHF